MWRNSSGEDAMTRAMNPFLVGFAAILSLWLVLPRVGAAPDPAAENFAVEHEIGRRFHFDPAGRRPPQTPPIVSNRWMTIPFGEQTLALPKGFTATPFAVGLLNPRRLLVLPNGDILVAEQSQGYLTLLRDGGDGRARWIDRH